MSLTIYDEFSGCGGSSQGATAVPGTELVLAASQDPNRGLLSTHLHTDGRQAEILYIPAGGSRLPTSAAPLSSSRWMWLASCTVPMT